MPILSCYVSDETMEILRRASADLGRTITTLAEDAISETACRYAVDKDPAGAIQRATAGIGGGIGRAGEFIAGGGATAAGGRMGGGGSYRPPATGGEGFDSRS